MTPEKRIENQVRQHIVKNQGWEVKFFASPHTNKGIPDVLASLKSRFCAFEIKRLSGGKPTPIQLWTLQQIANAGGFAVVTNDPNIVDRYIQYEHQLDNLTKEDLKQHFNIDCISFTEQPSVTTATNAWQQTTGVHTLWIRQQ